jgi:hypothetical protein
MQAPERAKPSRGEIEWAKGARRSPCTRRGSGPGEAQAGEKERQAETARTVFTEGRPFGGADRHPYPQAGREPRQSRDAAENPRLRRIGKSPAPQQRKRSDKCWREGRPGGNHTGQDRPHGLTESHQQPLRHPAAITRHAETPCARQRPAQRATG